jgi:hypothetical protein
MENATSSVAPIHSVSHPGQGAAPTHLTGMTVLSMLVAESGMRTLDMRAGWWAAGRTGICLAVVALLLYNPFFTILSASQDLSVQHLLSYRATVASSELRRATIEASGPVLPALTAVVFWAAASVMPALAAAPFSVSDAACPKSRLACDGIWFRPPPSA